MLLQTAVLFQVVVNGVFGLLEVFQGLEISLGQLHGQLRALARHVLAHGLGKFAHREAGVPLVARLDVVTP